MWPDYRQPTRVSGYDGSHPTVKASNGATMRLAILLATVVTASAKMIEVLSDNGIVTEEDVEKAATLMRGKCYEGLEIEDIEFRKEKAFYVDSVKIYMSKRICSLFGEQKSYMSCKYGENYEIATYYSEPKVCSYTTKINSYIGTYVKDTDATLKYLLVHLDIGIKRFLESCQDQKKQCVNKVQYQDIQDLAGFRRQGTPYPDRSKSRTRPEEQIIADDSVEIGDPDETIRAWSDNNTPPPTTTTTTTTTTTATTTTTTDRGDTIFVPDTQDEMSLTNIDDDDQEIRSESPKDEIDRTVDKMTKIAENLLYIAKELAEEMGLDDSISDWKWDKDIGNLSILACVAIACIVMLANKCIKHRRRRNRYDANTRNDVNDRDDPDGHLMRKLVDIKQTADATFVNQQKLTGYLYHDSNIK